MVLLGKLLPAGPLVYDGGKKSENGQYLAAKFSQRQGGLGVKITITTRVRSQKCEILVIATPPAFFLSNHDGIPLVKNTKISQNR